ncbi:MAG: DUF6600 domain-containing protein [Rudaea sp.]
MTRTHSLTRWANLLALGAAFLSCAIPVARAQDAAFDPPVRVGRMSHTSGPVSFSPAGSEEWVEARINRPVVTGDRLWTDDGARAEVSVDNSTWWVGERTSLDVSNLDDRIVQMQVQEGVLEARVRRLPPNNIVEIDTPNLAFSITRPGRYRIEVDAHDGSTLVMVREGMGEVYGETASYVVMAGQAYRFYGTDVRDSEFVAVPPFDAFDRFVQERDRRYARVTSVRYVSPEVIGYEDLDSYGSWSVVASYGDVWFPRRVHSDWAPYRFGHWTWIDPWGWTWVDDEPWGFAPFHYGRWAHFDRGWGWVPGPRHVRPVYAPALVAFIGGAGFSLSVSSGPAIGWFPLGPREVYVPPYHVSRDYFRQVNVSNTVVNVTNITNIYNNPARAAEVNYVNRRAPNAVTAVPPAAFAQAENVSRAAVPIAAAAVQRAQVHAVAPVAPARPALLGGGPVARAKPPASVVQRPMVAKAPPPAPPIPVAARLPALEKNPGRPLDRAQVQQLRQAAPPPSAPRPAVKVVEQPKPAPRAAPPARAATPGRAGAGAPSAGAPRPEAEGRAAPTLPGAGPRAPGGPTVGPEAGRNGRGQPPAGAPQRAPGAAVIPPAAAPPAAAPTPGARAPGERGSAARPPAAGPPEAGGSAPALRAPQTPPGQAQRPPTSNGPAARALREQGAPPPTPRPEVRAPGSAERVAPRPPEARPVPQGPAEPRGASPRAPQAAQPEGLPRAAPPQRPVEPPRVAPQRAPEPRAVPQRPPEARPSQPEPRAAPRPQEVRPQPQRAQEPRPTPQRPPEVRAPQPPPQARPEVQRPPQARAPQPQPGPEARPAPARPQGQPGGPPAAPKSPGKDNDKKDKDKKGDNG